MSAQEFVGMVARMNTSAECPECLTAVDVEGRCPQCGNESDSATQEHLAEALDSLITEAREVR